MDNIKVYEPETIPDTPFPQEGPVDYGSVTPTGGGQTLSPTTTKEQTFPKKRVAVELLSTALNTRTRKILQEFEFTEFGGIKVGNYENGISGDIRITSAGIVARNSSGINTIAIDGETGDATFAGTLQSGTLISGLVVVGNNALIFDGEERRIMVNDETNDIILIGKQVGGF